MKVTFGTGSIGQPDPTTTVPNERGNTITPVLAPGQNIIIASSGCKPQTLEASVTAPVVWTNLSGKPQRVIFVGFPIDSGTIPVGGTFTWSTQGRGRDGIQARTVGESVQAVDERSAVVGALTPTFARRLPRHHLPSTNLPCRYALGCPGGLRIASALTAESGARAGLSRVAAAPSAKTTGDKQSITNISSPRCVDFAKRLRCLPNVLHGDGSRNASARGRATDSVSRDDAPTAGGMPVRR